MPVVLGIETSCDETAAALVVDGAVVAEVVYSQKVHASYGGVVPELASRDHVRKLCPIVRSVLDSASVSPRSLGAVAVAAGPGLPGALLVGACFAKGLAAAAGIPIVPVNHIEAHIFATKLGCDFAPPFLALVVSGGHTEIALVEDWGSYSLLGSTRDDAAGEAFDKVAAALGLPYPGGPQIDRLAAEGNPNAFELPRAMAKSGDLDFSFSGLKTAVLNLLDSLGPAEAKRRLPDIAASFQEAVVDALLMKLAEASKLTGVRSVAIVGGVAANRRLREKASEADWELCIPPPKYCTDNGATIAVTGEFYLMRGQTADLSFPTKPNWTLGESLL